MRLALLRFHTGGSNVSPNQTLLPPSKLGGELGPNKHNRSRQLWPPSGPARTEGCRFENDRLEAYPTVYGCIAAGMIT